MKIAVFIGLFKLVSSQADALHQETSLPPDTESPGVADEWKEKYASNDLLHQQTSDTSTDIKAEWKPKYQKSLKAACGQHQDCVSTCCVQPRKLQSLH